MWLDKLSKHYSGKQLQCVWYLVWLVCDWCILQWMCVQEQHDCDANGWNTDQYLYLVSTLTQHGLHGCTFSGHTQGVLAGGGVRLVIVENCVFTGNYNTVITMGVISGLMIITGNNFTGNYAPVLTANYDPTYISEQLASVTFSSNYVAYNTAPYLISIIAGVYGYVIPLQFSSNVFVNNNISGNNLISFVSISGGYWSGQMQLNSI